MNAAPCLGNSLPLALRLWHPNLHQLTCTFQILVRVFPAEPYVTRPAPIPVGDPRMKLNPWYLVAPIPVVLMAANGPFGAQLAVLGVTIGIFFGTLALGRPTPGNATTTNH